LTVVTKITRVAAMTNGESTADSAVVQPSTEPGTKRKTSLVVLGLVLIALFLVGLVLARVWGTETVETSTPTSTTATQVTKTTEAKELPSDTLLTALLATGGILVLLGLLYTRITAIKVPGGGEITFIKPEEKEQVKEKVTAAIEEKKAAGATVSEADAAKVAVDALANLAEQKKQITTGPAPSEVVDSAVQSAVAQNLP
jgi:hypothetical protein